MQRTYDTFSQALRPPYLPVLAILQNFIGFFDSLALETHLTEMMASVKHVAIRFDEPPRRLFSRAAARERKRDAECRQALLLLPVRFPAASFYVARRLPKSDDLAVIGTQLGDVFEKMVIHERQGRMLRQLQEAIVQQEQLALRRGWPPDILSRVLRVKALSRCIQTMQFTVLGYKVQKAARTRRSWRRRPHLLDADFVGQPLPLWIEYQH